MRAPSAAARGLAAAFGLLALVALSPPPARAAETPPAQEEARDIWITRKVRALVQREVTGFDFDTPEERRKHVMLTPKTIEWVGEFTRLPAYQRYKCDGKPGCSVDLMVAGAFELGDLFERGEGVPQSLERAAQFYQVACWVVGHPEACLRLGRIQEAFEREVPQWLWHYLGLQFQMKVAKVYERAEHGSPGAMFRLGRLHANGTAGLRPDRAKALGLWWRAAVRGSLEAQREIDARDGWLLDLGDRIAMGQASPAEIREHEEARPFGRAAVARGLAEELKLNLRVLRSLAERTRRRHELLVEVGRLRALAGGEGALRQAFATWQVAALQGDPEAQLELAEAFEHGRGVAPDPDAAHAWHALARASGSACRSERCRRHAQGWEPDGAWAFERLAKGEARVWTDPAFVRDFPNRSGDKAGRKRLELQALFGLGLREELRLGADAAAKLAARSLYERAARGGHREARFRLALLLPAAEAIPWLRQAADQGHPFALHWLGSFTASGSGLPADPERAAALFEKAAEAGVAIAENQLARVHASGTGVPADRDRSRYWDARATGHGLPWGSEPADDLQKRAEAGDPAAQYEAGLALHFGARGLVEPAEAIGWYRQAAGQGHAGARWVLERHRADLERAEAARVAPDPGAASADLAHPCMRFVTGDESGWCLAKVAEAWLEGGRASRDPGHGLALLERAARRGVARAIFLLGRATALGLAGPRDPVEAASLYRAAMARGSDDAALALSRAHAAGDGVPRDIGLSEALVRRYRIGTGSRPGQWSAQPERGIDWPMVTWLNGLDCHLYIERADREDDRCNGPGVLLYYEEAAAKGVARAELALGDLLRAEGNVPPERLADYRARRLAHYRSAAERGLAEGQLALARFLRERGDEADAVAWLRKAAEQGNADGQYALGMAYHGGQGLPADSRLAAEWYGRAAAQGQWEAQAGLAALHLAGIGVLRDGKRAVELLVRSARHGHEPATRALEALGQPVP